MKALSEVRDTMNKVGEKEAEREETLTVSQVDKGELSGPALFTRNTMRATCRPLNFLVASF